ncbi:hypothetical protein FM125_05090 [Micrococcus lylae]|uniref:Uncharacterized protein n=1 Tax=Micrococcus lylae TaxID=1273 RepID=A0A1R4IXJ2_9MICC|nr:hypothetical protein FM125_05090 [Micrococcus lylae]
MNHGLHQHLGRRRAIDVAGGVVRDAVEGLCEDFIAKPGSLALERDGHEIDCVDQMSS